MRSRKTFAVLAGLSTVGILIAGCSPAADGGDDGPITLTYVTSVEDATLAAGEMPAIEAFEKANPDIDVKVEQIPFGEYNTKIQTEMRGGGGPDVGRVNHTDIQTYAAADFLLPLDDAIDDGTIDTEPLIPGLVEVGQVRDAQLTLPLTTDARVLFVNTRLLTANGIDAPPTTWDELLTAVKAFAGTDVYGYGFPLDSDYSLSYESAGPYINTAGGAILNEDGSAAVAAKDDATVDALQLLQDIVATGAVPPGLDNLAGDALAQLFASDKLAMMLGGPWVRPQIESYNDQLVYGEDWVTVPVPVQNDGDKSSSTAGGWQIGAFKNTDHPEAAMKLVAWMVQAENLENINREEAFPPTKDGLDVAPWSDDPFFDAFAEVLPNSRVPITPVPRMAEVSAAFENVLEPVIVKGSGSVEDALGEFDSQADAIIK